MAWLLDERQKSCIALVEVRETTSLMSKVDTRNLSIPDDLCRDSIGNAVSWDVFGHDGPGPNNRMRTDLDLMNEGGSDTYGGVLENMRVPADPRAWANAGKVAHHRVMPERSTGIDDAMIP